MTLVCADRSAPALPPSEVRRRVLFICHHFPPVGGAGVQRPVKFVKYLVNYGWEASVLTVANPSVPVFDNSLAADLPDDLVIERARTWEPGYQVKQQLVQSDAAHSGLLARARAACRGAVKGGAGLVLQPDPQVLWIPKAFQAATRLLQRLRHDAIFATAPPFSSLMLAAMLKQRVQLPLVLDFRDEWDLSSQYLENRRRDWITQRVQESLQRGVLRRADAIIATTRASTERLRERLERVGNRAPATCIYNGYDADDFSRPLPTRPEGARFRLVYTGTLWNLTTVEPVVRAIQQLQQSTPEVLDRLELVFVGRKTPPQQSLLDELRETRCRLDSRDYCAHQEALDIMRSADGLCLLLTDVPGAERVAPAKLFEYLAARRPLLAVTPPGETADLVRGMPQASHFVPSDCAGIARWLSDQVTRFTAGVHRDVPDPAAERVAAFSRQRQAGELACLLDSIVQTASRTRTN